MEYSSDMDRRLTEAEAIAATEVSVSAEIHKAFEDFFSGNAQRRVPSLRINLDSRYGEEAELVADVLHDMLYDGAPKSALVALLQGTGTVDALRAALAADYVSMMADEIAQHRVLFADEPIPAFVMEASHV